MSGEVVTAPLEPGSPLADSWGGILARGRSRHAGLHLHKLGGWDVLEYLIREDQLLRFMLGGHAHRGRDRVSGKQPYAEEDSYRTRRPLQGGTSQQAGS